MPKTKSLRPGLTPLQVRRVRAALRRLIAEKEGNQSEAARALGITPAAVCQIAGEKNAPSVATAIALARATGTTLSALLGEA